jgi:phenylalanine ammonia-lyase
LSPLPALVPKEHLGILNGTAFSSSVGALAVWDSVQMVLGGVICTAMGVEAMAGSRGNYVPFVHKEARPHPGQVCWDLHEQCFEAVTHNAVILD